MCCFFNLYAIAGRAGATVRATLQVQAHGGQLLQWGGRFYWVGEGAKPFCDYTANPWDAPDNPCYGKDVSQHLNLYSSTNLASWTFEGVLLDQARSRHLLASSRQSGLLALVGVRECLL